MPILDHDSTHPWGPPHVAALPGGHNTRTKPSAGDRRTLKKETKRLEDEPEPETKSERIEPDRPNADPTPTTSLSSEPTYSSLTGAHADD
ncbi:hypothetical protein ACFQMM_15220 [Saliphagus sp. GCM10025308]